MARMPFLRVSVRVELSLGKHVRCSDMRHFVEKRARATERDRERERAYHFLLSMTTLLPKPSVSRRFLSFLVLRCAFRVFPPRPCWINRSTVQPDRIGPSPEEVAMDVRKHISTIA